MKKVMFSLCALTILALSGVAYAQDAGHVGPIINIVEGSVEQLQPNDGILEIIGDSAVIVTTLSFDNRDFGDSVIRNSVTAAFAEILGREPGRVEIEVLPPLVGTPGLNAIKLGTGGEKGLINALKLGEQSNNVTGVSLFLHNRAGGLTELEYSTNTAFIANAGGANTRSAVNLAPGTFALLDVDGKAVEKLEDDAQYVLVFDIQDSSPYDLDPAIGATRAEAELARAAAGGGGDGGGGCDSGLFGSFAALSLLAGACVFGKRGA
jgi:hypothetical protein